MKYIMMLFFIFNCMEAYASDIKTDLQLHMKEISGFNLGDSYIGTTGEKLLITEDVINVKEVSPVSPLITIGLMIDKKNVIYSINVFIELKREIQCADIKSGFVKNLEEKYNINFKSVVDNGIIIDNESSSFYNDDILVNTQCNKVLFQNEIFSFNISDFSISESFNEKMDYRERNKKFLESNMKK